MDRNQTKILTRLIQGKLNVLADELSHRKQALPTEWTLDPLVCLKLWKRWGKPVLDLFATAKNFCLPLYCSPAPDLKTWVMDAMLVDWSDKDLYAFPPFKMVREVISKFWNHQNVTVTLIAPFWPTQELLTDFPRLLPQKLNLLKQPHFRQFHQGLSTLALTAFRLSGN